MKKLMICAAAILALAGCSSSGSSSSEPLRDASAVAASSSASVVNGAKTVDLGQSFTVAGITVVISDPKLSGDSSGPWIEVHARLENHGTGTTNGLNTGIICSGASESGGTQAGSTIFLGSGVPAKSYLEGTVNMLVSGDSRTGVPVAACATPAFVYLQPVFNSQAPMKVALPDSLIASLNAARVAPSPTPTMS